MASLQNADVRQKFSIEMSPNITPNDATDTEFSHPVYKKLSVMNGEVNRMTKQAIQNKLASLGLDTRGNKDVIKRRLKMYYKNIKLAKEAKIVKPKRLKYDYIMVIDFEATCEKNHRNYNHEIIEFPIVVVSTLHMKIVDEFHSYVRPVKNPRLTDFCTDLTGITQRQVDAAPAFSEVLKNVESFLSRFSNMKFVVLSDGPWDMSRFLRSQCTMSKLPMPKWGKRWINIRKSYSNFYKLRRTGLSNMLENLGLRFEGHMHSGIDDARNIARIAIRLLEDGCQLHANERLYITSNQLSLEELSNADNEGGEVDYVNCDDAESDGSNEVTDCFGALSLNSPENDLSDLLAYYALQ